MNLTPNGFLKQQNQQQLANPIKYFFLMTYSSPFFLWGCQLQTLFFVAEILPASELTNIGAYDLAGELGENGVKPGKFAGKLT
jgi:hypothetical protein